VRGRRAAPNLLCGTDTDCRELNRGRFDCQFRGLQLKFQQVPGVGAGQFHCDGDIAPVVQGDVVLGPALAPGHSRHEFSRRLEEREYLDNPFRQYRVFRMFGRQYVDSVHELAGRDGR
jgi:hypothetical protein